MVNTLPPLLESYPDYVLSLIASFTSDSSSAAASPTQTDDRLLLNVVTPVSTAFLSVSANFLVRKSSVTATTKQIDNATAERPSLAPSPSSQLCGWWLEHSSFYEFLLISSHSFEFEVALAPVFSVTTVADVRFPPGQYLISDGHISTTDQREDPIVTIREFTMAESLLLPRVILDSEYCLFFTLS